MEAEPNESKGFLKKIKELIFNSPFATIALIFIIGIIVYILFYNYQKNHEIIPALSGILIFMFFGVLIVYLMETIFTYESKSNSSINPFDLLFEKVDKLESQSSSEISNLNRKNNENSIPKIFTEKDYLHEYTLESKETSDLIFSRAGVYLLIGILVAFVGIVIFLFLSFGGLDAQINTTENNPYSLLKYYTPRFGALFFIEFIAFFFLKQYRIMMEEYRYYEAIKRKRQDNVVLIELVEKHGDKPETLKLIIDTMFQTESKKLANGESTEILETHKIVNQDLDIFGKFTDLINAIKSK